MSTARRCAVRPGGDVLCRVLECVSLSASRSRVLRIRMRHEPACVCRSECELSERRPELVRALREGRERPRAAGRRGATRPTRPPGPLPTPPRPAARRSRAGSRSGRAPGGCDTHPAPGARGRESQNGETANSVNGAPVRRGSGRARRRGGRRARAAGSLSHDASRSTKPVSHLAVPRGTRRRRARRGRAAAPSGLTSPDPQT
jgi:hypothetical protein